MIKNTDLKKFFNEEDSFEQDGKKIYLVPLKEFMKTEEFQNCPEVSRKDKDPLTGEETITKCKFLNSSAWTDVYPHLIIEKTKSEKTVWCIDLDSKVVSGTWPDVEYEIMVRVNADGSLYTDFKQKIHRAREKCPKDGKFYNLNYFKDGCEHFVPTTYPRYYRDPSF